MDATCAIQASIHVFSLVRKYVSRILGTYQKCGGLFMSVTNSGIWTVFLSGIFSGAEDTGKSIAAKISETGGSMRGGNLYLYSGIWSKVERFPGNGI